MLYYDIWCTFDRLLQKKYKGGKGSACADTPTVMPLVSVIMPAYKVEQYLDQCLKSVVEQDLKDIEIIAIDNGSPDGCGDIIRKFAKQDQRINPIFIKKNEGYAHAINVGLETAKGKYIAIVETDDYVEPDMLSTLYHAAEKHGAKIAKGGFTKHFPDGATLYCKPSCTFYDQEVIVEPLCNNDILYMESSIWSAIYDREFLLENDIKMPEFSGAAYQDVIFKFMAYTVVDFLVCIDKSVYNYRVFSANSSSKSTQYWDRHFENYGMIKAWLLEKGTFESYKHAYYIGMVADFIFHYNRLSGKARDQFCEKAGEVCREALENGVDIFNPRFRDKGFERYYWTEVIPLLEKITHTSDTQMQAPQEERTFGHGFRGLVKRTLKALNKVKVFNKFFNNVLAILRKPYFLSKILTDMPSPAPMTALSNMDHSKGYIEVSAPSDKKKVLIILPWYDNNAVTHNMDILAAMFKDLGYETHLFVYWNWFAPNVQNRKVWDKVFWQHADNLYFGQNDSTEGAVDGNRVDDWVSDDFLESVIRLNNHFKYDICIANYLIFTSAFMVLPASVKKVLYTHDRLAKRNSALQKAGFSSESFWFSVATEEEEASALRRADIILAIQEEDGEYFRRITNNEKRVMVVPFIPDADFIDYREALQDKTKLEVGYIAGANPPNIAAIKNVIAQIGRRGRVRLHVAGSITYALEGGLFHQNVINEGTVDSLKDFYSKCDVMINPDMFYSGLKVKTAEAMSFGAAIVCTKIAGTGLPLDKVHHQMKNEAACVEYLKEIARKNYDSRCAEIQEMRADSREKYLLYQKKYPLDELIKAICE